MADEKPYNISIETKAQISELQKLLAELQSINAEIGKMNGLTLSSINTSVSELVKTGKELSNTFVSLSKPADKLANGLKKIGEKSDESGDKLDGLKTTAQGVFMEIGAQITDFAVNKLKQIPAAIIGSIQAFGQQDAAVQKVRSSADNVFVCLGNAAHNNLRRRTGACNAVYGDSNGGSYGKIFNRWRARYKVPYGSIRL